MAWKRFTKTRSRSFVPKVGIWARGQIGFNKGAVEKYKLEQYDYVVLFFDEEQRRIGIKLTTDAKEEGATKVTKRQSAISFSANAFLNTFEIDHEKTRKYDVGFNQEEGMFIIQLEK
jgi:hypothetical protein